MSIAVACRRSLVLGQSADCRGLRHWFGHRDGGHLAGFYVIVGVVVVGVLLPSRPR